MEIVFGIIIAFPIIIVYARRIGRDEESRINSYDARVAQRDALIRTNSNNH